MTIPYSMYACFFLTFGHPLRRRLLLSEETRMDDSAMRMFAAGEQVTLATDHEQRLVFTIERPFSPFTKSVAVLARCAELSSTPVVVKIFDPRFLDERLPMKYRRARP